jgi:hypothetical protein
MTKQSVKNAAIDSHDLLDDAARQLCKQMRTMARATGEPFSMLAFAEIHLRASAKTYAEADERDNAASTMMASRDLRRAAILYVYEALKATDIAIISEYPDLPEALDLLTWINRDLP